MPEIRRDPLTMSWRVIDTGFFGKIADDSIETCPLCPGHEHLTQKEIYAIRPRGSPANSPGWSVRVIPSENPILKLSTIERTARGMYDQISNKGANELVAVTPVHGKKLSEFAPQEVADVLRVYQQRIRNLKEDIQIREVLIYHFEPSDRGHARSHVFGLPVIDPRLGRILSNCREHYDSKERCLGCDIITEEKRFNTRIIKENDGFISYVPYAPKRDYAVIIMPTEHSPRFEDYVSGQNIYYLVDLILDVLKRYRALFDCVSWSLVLYTEPNIARIKEEWIHLSGYSHWFIEFLPFITSNLTNFHLLTEMWTTVDTPEKQAKLLREAEY